MTVFLAMLIKPFVLLGLLVIAYPIVEFIKRKLPEGKLKRFLFISWH